MEKFLEGNSDFLQKILKNKKEEVEELKRKVREDENHILRKYIISLDVLSSDCSYSDGGHFSELSAVSLNDKAEIANNNVLSTQGDTPWNNNNTNNNNNKQPFLNALKSPGLSIIAEIKRASPSAGKIADILSPVELAKEYEKSGANCISCLTDKKYFNGSLDDLRDICKNVDIPVLRKDFIIDEIQIAESKEAGAHCILLMVNVLKSLTPYFVKKAGEYGMECIVEVHNKEELNIAILSNPKIIGINNRDMHTFNVTLDTSLNLLKHIPPFFVRISESGIQNTSHACAVRFAGADAILVGESLVRAENKQKLIKELKRTCRIPYVKICGVHTPETAQNLVELRKLYPGIHITAGLVFAQKSVRYIGSVEEAKKISDILREGDVECWGVFDQQNATEIAHAVKCAQLTGVQLHGDTPRKAFNEILPSLPPVCRRVYVRHVNEDGRIIDDENYETIKNNFREGTDIVLFDAKGGGTGKAFNWESFRPPREPVFFLAGGLHPNNVESAIECVMPYGLDASSCLEEPEGSGVKSKDKIFLFLEKIKNIFCN